MGEHTLTLLHLSDLHQDATTSWRRRRVLGDAWKRNLDEMAGEGGSDLVCFTGDAAFSGQPAEYQRATVFFEEVLERLGLGWERFFPVPGNHDIDRGRGAAESRQGAYRQWVHGALGRPGLDPARSRHGRLGYRWTWPAGSLGALPFPVHLVGLDSAWACGDDSDAGKLWLTDEQVMRLATDEGKALAGFRLALMHHPLDELVDGAEARRLLAERVDLVLRGHLHDLEAQQWADPERRLLQLVGGCLYEHDWYPNACARLRVTLDGDGRPQRHELWFRGWSGRGHWHDDGSLYPGPNNGRLTWWIVGRPAEAAPDGRVARVFVGREPELEQLERHLLAAGGARPVAVCSLQGMAGVGKSYLADRFALLHRERFPGGVWRLVLEGGGDPPAPAKLLSELADRLKVATGGDGVAGRVRERLLQPRSLLHVENVDREPLAEVAAGLVALLPGCAVLVTGRYQGLGATAGWEQVALRPFDEATALAQLGKELGPETIRHTDEEKRQLVRAVGHLPLAVHLAAGHLREGFSVSVFLARLRATGFSLPGTEVVERAQSALTRESARQAIASTFTLSLEALGAHLAAEPEGDSERVLAGLFDLGHAPAVGFGESLGAALAGLAPAEFERLAAAARRLSILEAVAPTERRDRAWRLHSLLAELLRARGAAERAAVVHARLSEWFCSRLPKLPAGREAEQGRRWREVQLERGALVAWLDEVVPEEGVAVERAGARFAETNGPFHAWMRFCERLLHQPLAESERSDALYTLGQVAVRAGELERAAAAAQDKRRLDQARGDEREAAMAAGLLADVLQVRGDLDEALRIRREEELPVHERLGDVRTRAVTLGEIADALQARGELDEALRIWRDEELPVYEQLGDVWACAVTRGKIAGILIARGKVDEALSFWRDQELPVYEQIGDVRARALTLDRIADVLQARGDLDEALRIWREQVPVYEQLGDVRARAVTLGKIANVLRVRGELDEALRIRREEELPVYKWFGDVRACALTQGQIADVLQARGELDEALRIRREEELPVYERLGDVRARALTMGQIADVLQARGDLDEALRIRREEQLPVFEKLGDVRARAVALGKVADVLQQRGELDEALRIYREEELPVYEKLGDVRERAVTLGKVAGVLQARGELDEAVSIRREEELPVYERLGLAQDLVIGRWNLALVHLDRNRAGDREAAVALLRLALPEAERMRLPTAGKIRSKLQALGEEPLPPKP